MTYITDYKAASDAVAAAITSCNAAKESGGDTELDGGAVTSAICKATTALRAAQEILDGPTGNKGIYNSIHNITN
jgi:hypothetical protein